jgi:mycothiol conjugate amidase Mca
MMESSTGSVALLAVHAHPDDEAIGTGGILAHYSGEGRRVALVCATRGEEGEIVDLTIDQDEARPRLAEIREAELRCACDALGVSDLSFLNYRDSGMAGTPENEHPEAFCRADFAEATGRLVRIIRELRPEVVVTYDEKGGYGHPDHIMAHRVTVAAFDAAGDPARYPECGKAWEPYKLYYTAIPRSQIEQMEQYFRSVGITSPFEREDLTPERFGTPDEIVTTRVDVRDHLGQKLDALRCHRTQIAADSFFFKIPEEFSAQGFGYEHYVRVRSRVQASLPESDLFAGLSR